MCGLSLLELWMVCDIAESLAFYGVIFFFVLPVIEFDWISSIFSSWSHELGQRKFRVEV